MKLLHQFFFGSARRITQTAMVGMLLIGLCMVVFPLKPFWLDEWFIICNLKFRSSKELWGHLFFIQQFPRVYLQLLHWWNVQCNFSYQSMRLPGYIIHCLGMLFCYRLSRALFARTSMQRFLWVVLYLSFYTSLHYFVQVKQYTMEMLLGLLALWQSFALLQLFPQEDSRSFTYKNQQRDYLLLCASIVLAPFFSYTYPIALCPVYSVVFLKFCTNARLYQHILPGLLLPLALGITAIAAMYFLDTRQVMADQGMQAYWHDQLMLGGFSVSKFSIRLYDLFGQLGSGDLFHPIFGIIGLAALLVMIFRSVRNFQKTTTDSYLLLYAIGLIGLMIVLFIAHKLPLGIDRLNAFSVPVLAYVLVRFLNVLAENRRLKILAKGLTALLFWACTINIITSYSDQFFSPDARMFAAIYKNTNDGLLKAKAEKLPVMATASVGYPADIFTSARNVLLAQPAFDRKHPVLIYSVASEQEARRQMQLKGISRTLFIDSLSQKILE